MLVWYAPEEAQRAQMMKLDKTVLRIAALKGHHDGCVMRRVADPQI